MRPFPKTFAAVMALVALLCPLASVAAETQGTIAESGGAHGINERMVELILQLAVIFIAVKIGGFVCRRYLRIPDVLGELAAGILLGPYLLGPVLGLFAAPVAGAFPVSHELYGVATLASIVLLYLAGLETDIGMFMRYSVVGSAVGVGGVVVSFILGDLAAVLFGLAPSFGSPAALFMGTISTATSVGITARVLSQRNKLDSPEGVTVLAGAVVDDVLGIVVLAVVVGVCRVQATGGAVDWVQIGVIAARALGFWVGCTALGMLLARRMSKLLEFFGSTQTMAVLSLGIALLLAGLAEKAGLAMIIGAYITGLSFSRVDAAAALRDRLEPVYSTLVGVFFAVMGMMVDLSALRSVLVVGVLYAFAAILAKMLGCGLPALLTRFRVIGALRIGAGMLPRGEVTLLIAGIGLSSGFIDVELFGVAVMMTLISTLLAPLLMSRLFTDTPGVKPRYAEQAEHAARNPIRLELQNRDVAEFLLERIVAMFEAEECYVHQLVRGERIYQIRKDDVAISVRRQGTTVIVSAREQDREYARLMLMEALAGLVGLFDGLRRMDEGGDLRTQILEA
jgi:Kef-type K+ transport system membrane component KefB